jgi:hypothetical protein
MAGAAVACEVMWVAGSGSWLVGPPLAGIWAMWCPIWLYRRTVVGPHSFVAKSCGDDMTKPNSLRRSSSYSCFLRIRQRALIVSLSGQRGCGHCPHPVHNRLFYPHFDPLSWFCLHYFMQFSVADDMTSRLRSSVSLDVPGSAGTLWGYLRLWRPIRPQSGGVWDPDSSSGQPWFG